MHFIETHAHLDASKYDHDRDAVVQRAVDAGIVQIVTVGADLPSSRAAVDLAGRYEMIYAAVGVHPHDAASVGPATLGELRELALHPRVVAVGEIGLDFYRNYAPREAQRKAFEGQLALASEIGKPVIVHIRDDKGQVGAYDTALSILCAWLPQHPARHSNVGVLHCFSGDLGTARAALDLGFYLGIDGPVTYPNAKPLQSLVAELPLDRLMLETDCPYLAPQARRGRRNEPAFIPYIADKVAELQGTKVQAVALVTTANAQRLFGLVEG